MSTLALKALQQALYSKLSGDGVLMGMVTGLYDVVPQRTTAPFVVLGDGSAQGEEASGVAVTRCSLTVHVWTEAVGRKAALIIMDRIYGLLHEATLTISGYQLVLMRGEKASTQLADEGAYLHGQLGFTVMLAENAA